MAFISQLQSQSHVLTFVSTSFTLQSMRLLCWYQVHELELWEKNFALFCIKVTLSLRTQKDNFIKRPLQIKSSKNPANPIANNYKKLHNYILRSQMNQKRLEKDCYVVGFGKQSVVIINITKYTYSICIYSLNLKSHS